MYVDPDPVLNQAIADELKKPVRVLVDLIYFDWDNDGYQSEYSDMSAVLVSADLERSALQSDLPEQVNTIQGYSSAELQVTLRGNRDSSEPDVAQLLSRFNVSGPFFNRELTGTTVKFEKRIETPKGNVDIRQFTGQIRDIQITRSTGEVKIIATDIWQWATRTASFPFWAIDKSTSANGDLSPTAGIQRSINASWLLTEALRQAGTPVAPPERSDCFVSFSCVGSMLHSVGEPWHDPGSIDPSLHVMNWGNVNIMTGWGPWAPAMTPGVGSGSSRTFFANQAYIDRTKNNGFFKVPRAGTSEAGKNLGVTFWAQSDGSASRGLPTGSPPYYYDGLLVALSLTSSIALPEIWVQHGKNGQIYVTILDWPGGTMTPRQFGWAPKAAGWHHYDVNIRFRNNQITAVLTVDGVDQGAPTLGSFPTVGYTYVANSYPTAINDLRSNPMQIRMWDPAQFVQVYGGGTDSVYSPSQVEPVLTKDGLPWLVWEGCHAEMDFIPDTYEEYVWDILKNLTTGEFAGLYTNEYGQLTFYPHWKLRQTIPLNSSETYTVDDLEDLVTNPSLDQYRNTIAVTYTSRAVEIDDVWTNTDSLGLRVVDDGVSVLFDPIYLSGEVIKIVTLVRLLSGWNDATTSEWYEDRTTRAFLTMSGYNGVSGGSSNIYDGLGSDGLDPLHDGSGSRGFSTANASIIPGPDGRSFQIRATAPANSWATGVFFGAKAIQDSSGNQTVPSPAFWVKGAKYGSQIENLWIETNDAEVLDKGRAVLKLEASVWRQTEQTAAAIAPQLLSDLTNPSPVISGLSIPSDPRLQITDVITLYPEGEYSNSGIQAQILGIRRPGDGNDELDLRITRAPSKWVLGASGASELGQTTVLN